MSTGPFPPGAFPPGAFPPEVFPPGAAPPRGSRTRPLASPPTTEDNPYTDLQLVRRVRMIPVVVVPGAEPVVYERESERLSPIGAQHPQSHIFESPPRAGGDVTLTFTGLGDFENNNELVAVWINGIGACYAFVGGHLCPDVPDTDQHILTAEQWNEFIDAGSDGHVRVDMLCNALVDPAPPGCGYETFVQVKVHYLEAAPPDTDPAYIGWRSEGQVLLGDGTTDWLWGEVRFDPVTGCFVVEVPSASLNTVSLAGLDVAGGDGETPAYICAEAIQELRGNVVSFSSAGGCSTQYVP
jgi:hypothetical protein